MKREESDAVQRRASEPRVVGRWPLVLVLLVSFAVFPAPTTTTESTVLAFLKADAETICARYTTAGDQWDDGGVITPGAAWRTGHKLMGVSVAADTSGRYYLLGYATREHIYVHLGLGPATWDSRPADVSENLPPGT